MIRWRMQATLYKEPGTLSPSGSTKPGGARESAVYVPARAIITSKVKKKKEEEGAKIPRLFRVFEPLAKIPSHRLLALRRGEEEGILSVDISPDEDAALEALDRLFYVRDRACKDQLEIAIAE